MKKTKKEVVEGDVTHLIERLEAFEERIGVRLEALFAHIEECMGETAYLNVKGEVHPREGATIKESIYVHVDACDSSGRLVAMNNDGIEADKFFGFEAFEVEMRLPIRELSKIRVYPKMRPHV